MDLKFLGTKITSINLLAILFFFSGITLQVRMENMTIRPHVLQMVCRQNPHIVY